MYLRELTVDTPLTVDEMMSIHVRLDDIENRLEDPDVTPNEVAELITELSSILEYTERAETISKFKFSGLSIVK